MARRLATVHVNGSWFVSRPCFCKQTSAVLCYCVTQRQRCSAHIPFLRPWAQVTGMALTALSLWISWLAWKERRRWLLTWSAVYGLMSAFMTALAYALGPDPHDVFGALLAGPAYIPPVNITGCRDGKCGRLYRQPMQSRSARHDGRVCIVHHLAVPANTGKLTIAESVHRTTCCSQKTGRPQEGAPTPK